MVVETKDAYISHTGELRRKAFCDFHCGGGFGGLIWLDLAGSSGGSTGFVVLGLTSGVD